MEEQLELLYQKWKDPYQNRTARAMTFPVYATFVPDILDDPIPPTFYINGIPLDEFECEYIYGRAVTDDSDYFISFYETDAGQMRLQYDEYVLEEQNRQLEISLENERRRRDDQKAADAQTSLTLSDYEAGQKRLWERTNSNTPAAIKKLKEDLLYIRPYFQRKEIATPSNIAAQEASDAGEVYFLANPIGPDGYTGMNTDIGPLKDKVFEAITAHYESANAPTLFNPPLKAAIRVLREYFGLRRADYPNPTFYIELERIKTEVATYFGRPLNQEIYEPRDLVTPTSDPFLSQKMTMAPIFTEEEIEELELINLNPILPEDLLDDKKRILDPNFKLWSSSPDGQPNEDFPSIDGKRVKAADGEFSIAGTKAEGQIKNFYDVYASSTQSLRWLFEMHQKTLEDTLANDPTSISANGNDFELDFENLELVMRAIEIIKTENTFAAKMPISEQEFDTLSKFQATLAVTKGDSAVVRAIFIYYFDKDFQDYEATPFREPVIKTIAVKNGNPDLPPPFPDYMSGNTVRYLSKIRDLEEAAYEIFGEDYINEMQYQRDSQAKMQAATKKLEKRYNGCFSPDSWYANIHAGMEKLLTHKYADIFKFSKEFQKPPITKKAGTEEEKNKDRAKNNTEDVSAFKKIMTGTKKDIEKTVKDIAINATAEDYTVREGDKIEISVDPNASMEFNRIGDEADSVLKDLRLQIVGHPRQQTSDWDYLRAPGSLADLAVTRNFPPTEDWFYKLNPSFMPTTVGPETKNVPLKAGQIIKIPKAGGFDPGAMQAAGASMFSGITEDIGVEEWPKFFKEALLDPLILKICPETLPSRIVECLLPSNCRELIKYVGLWRARQLLEYIVQFDVFEFRDSRPGIQKALDEWDELISDRYNFKAVTFNGDGFLKSGPIDGNILYPAGADKVSVSLLVRITAEDNSANGIPNQRKINGERQKCILTQKGTFSIRTKKGNISIFLTSADGKEVEYTLTGSDKFHDGKFHQVGFSWLGAIGELVAIIDGQEIPTILIDGEKFRGPLAVEEKSSATPSSTGTSEIIVASANSEKSVKGFAGQIDEICIFNKVLSPQDWVKLAKVQSDQNLSTKGLSRYASAWWRMGDTVGDALTSRSIQYNKGEIVDRISSINLSPVTQPDGGVREDDPRSPGKAWASFEKGSQFIVVTRLFKPSDEDEFLSIIDRNVDLVRLCDYFVKQIKDVLAFAADPEKIIDDIEAMLKIPEFPKDPHFEIEVFIKKAVFEQLIKQFSQFLLDLVEEYILNCENWRGLVQALVKGTLSGGDVGAAWKDAFGDNMNQNPLMQLLGGNVTFEDMFKAAAPAIANSIESVISSTGFQYSADGQTPTSLGLGTVLFSNRAQLAADIYDMPGSTGASSFQVAIQNGNMETAATIELIKKTTEEIRPDEALELFSGNASAQTLEKVKQVVRDNFSDSSVINVETVPILFASFAEAIGAGNSINQFQVMSQFLMNNFPPSGDPCDPGSTFRDKIGQGLDRMQDQRGKDLIDKGLDLGQERPPNNCPLAIPLTAYERRALRNTITTTYTPVLSAYDNDLNLYRVGLTSVGKTEEKIRKIYWKGETITQKVFDGNAGVEEKAIEIEKTQVNPTFKVLIEQGYIPMTSKGEVDGTEYGGVVKTQWNPFKDNWLGEKRPPESLVAKQPATEDDDVEQPDIDIGDLHKSLGPYTDYDDSEEVGGSAYAAVQTPSVKLGGKSIEALSMTNAKFSMSDEESEERAYYFKSRKEAESWRGYKNIISSNESSIYGSGMLDENYAGDTNSRSTMVYQTKYGTELAGKKKISYIKKTPTGSNIYNFDANLDFKLSSDLRQKILDSGFQDAEPSEEVCDDASSATTAMPEELKYTPQENVFEFVVNNENSNLQVGADEIKTSVYDSVYRETLTAMMMKVADSPLLKTVPGTTDGGNAGLVGLNFLNLNQTPRLIDMESFALQVSEDYASLLACPDESTEAPIYRALKMSVTRMLARICLVDFMLRGIIPFSQLAFSKKDPVIKKFIIQKLEVDLNVFTTATNRLSKSEVLDGIHGKIVEEFNTQAASGDIDEDLLDVAMFRENWRDAIDYYIEDEFDFILNRIKETVHGGCIEEESESPDGITKDMYRAILKYANGREGNLRTEKYTVSKSGQKKTDYFVDSNEAQANLSKVGISLFYSHNNKKIVLCTVEKDYDEVKETLQIPDIIGEVDCDDRSLYSPEGETTKNHDHSHGYEIDANGNGRTTTTIGSSVPHTHPINRYTVVPKIASDGTVEHVHSLPKNPSEAQVAAGSLKVKIEDYMEELLIEEDNFKIMFDYCFDLKEVSSLVLVYSVISAENQIMLNCFNGTKKAIIDMYGWLWQEGPTTDPCSSDISKPFAPDFGDLLPDFGDFMDNPQALLMFILAPLLTFRGWTKTADPHVFVTTTIMDVFNMPINPKWSKKNIQVNPLDPTDVECMCWPSWPGTRPMDDITIATHFAINGLTLEAAVALGVTWAPVPITGVPFTPTPFGMWYYFLVMPLIWLIRDLPRLVDMYQQTDQGVQALASIGMGTGEIVCDPEDPTQSNANANQSSGEEDCPSLTQPTDCPPLKPMAETIIDVSSSEC